MGERMSHHYISITVVVGYGFLGDIKLCYKHGSKCVNENALSIAENNDSFFSILIFINFALKHSLSYTLKEIRKSLVVGSTFKKCPNMCVGLWLRITIMLGLNLFIEFV